MDPRTSQAATAAPPSAAEVVLLVPEPLSCDTAPAVLHAFEALAPSESPVRIDMSRVRHLDTFGLAALASGIRALRGLGRAVHVVELDPTVRRRATLLRVHDVLEVPPPASPAARGLLARAGAALQGLAASTVTILATLSDGVRYSVVDCATGALGREHLARQLDQIGLGGVSIVAGVNFLVGAIMALQTAYVLEFYGATLFVARGVGISMTRELGPLMAAVLVAGRSGSAIAAELGAMVVSEEVDALEMMALDPRRFLLSPRFAALVLAVPALSVLADIAGIIGGAIVMALAYRLDVGLYAEETIHAIYVSDVGSGLLKSLFFGALIATVSCHRGLALRGGPEAVGQAATSAVVHSIIAVVLFDAAFTTLTRGVL